MATKAKASAAEATCSAPGCEIMAVHKCSACGAAKYCSKECQKAHWKAGHKAACATLASTAKKTTGEKEKEKEMMTTTFALRPPSPCVFGKGRMRYPDGAEYEGDFHHGLMHGVGRIAYPSGDVYEGEFKLGREDGRGTLSKTDGKIYTGTFKDGKFDGQVKVKFNPQMDLASQFLALRR